jgi:predicted RNA-binding protein with PIN domain
MPVLVDGDNLLGTWPGRRRSDAERRDLAHELARYARRIRRQVVVVFDGRSSVSGNLGADVHFSGSGRSADDVILARLRQETHRPGWLVVTSDRSLADQCRWLEARVERCDRFRQKLATSPDREKPEREADIAYWLEQFGDD